jgi:methylthioxylose transferase
MDAPSLMVEATPDGAAVDSASHIPRRLWPTGARALWTAAVLVAAGAVLRYGFVEGERFDNRDFRIHLGAGPLVGEVDVRVNEATVVAVLFGVAVMVWGTRWVAQARQRWLLAGTALATGTFTALLTLNDNNARVLEPVVHRTEYWQAVKTAPPLREFVDSYVERLPGYSVHLRGHPPGYTALLLAGRAVGFTSPWVVAALSWIAAGIGAAAVVWTVLRIAGDAAARRLAPLLVVAPYAVWAGTSADAVYMALGALGCAALATAASTTGGRSWQAGWSVAAGALFGMLCFGTYGAVMLTPVALAVIAARRRWWLVLPTVVGVAVVVLGWLAAGFWWLEGARATQDQYWAGSAQFRTAVPFAVFNLAAMLVACGPAVLWAFTRIRRSAAMWLAAGGALAIAGSTLSQYSKGEVERIWLLFFPWLTVVVLCAVRSDRALRVAVAAQALTAIVIQSVLVSKW